MESRSFRDLLEYLQPQLQGHIPSRASIVRYTAHAYEKSLILVQAALARATTKIHLSFDLWTSPGRRLSLLGVVAHYLDDQRKPQTVLLALPRMTGSHTGVSIAKQLSEILGHFHVSQRFGHAIADNASENTACMNHLSEILNMDLDKRRIMCMGHVINLVAQECLFGSDVDAFEEELLNVTAEEIELRHWRKRGPIGKLHNLIRYIGHSSNRKDLLQSIQLVQGESRQNSDTSAHSNPRTYHLIRDNLTRWNSWYDAACRALQLRASIEEFIDHELVEYHAAMTRYSNSRSQNRKLPKKPSLLADVLDADDWSVIAQYVTLLRPLKQAIMTLQGHVSTTAKGDKAVKGAIWQVLPIFEVMLKAFEEARQRHLPVETLDCQRSQRACTQPTAPSQPPTTPPLASKRLTRRSQGIPIPRTSAPRDSPTTPDAPITAEEQMIDEWMTTTFDINKNVE